MSKWWAENMSDAGQGLFSDPATALQIATMPDQLLTGQATPSDQEARDARGGFMQQVMSGFAKVGKGLDGALSNVPGWGVTKEIANAAILQPVDKVASGMYWLYSNVVSQPLSTALLVGGKADIYGPGEFFSGDAWSDAYHRAEHISPGQAFYNVNRMAFSDLGSEVGAKPGETLNAQQKQQMERFIYDTDYWRNRDGWVYTAGTGTLDFMANLADPVAGAIAGGARAVKASRTIQLEGQATQKTVVGAFAQGLLEKSAEQAAASKRVEDAFAWMQDKTAAEIAMHPMWGRGRRKVVERHQLSELLSGAFSYEKPLILRFAMGDNAALQELAKNHPGLVTQIGTAVDNRNLLANHVWDGNILDAYVKAAAAKQLFPVGIVPPGEQALYAGAAQEAIKKKIQSNYGPSVWEKRAKVWQKNQLRAADWQIQDLQKKDAWYASALGDNLGKNVDDLSPADSTLFGTVKSLYRMNFGAIKDTEKAADKTILAATVDRKARKAKGNIVSRTIQNGYYSVPLRVYQSLGDSLPVGVVNHNDVDASDRVLDMLKQVPGLGQQRRLDLLNEYSRAGGKLQKSVALQKIQSEVVKHMVGRYNLNDETQRFADEIIKHGWEQQMFRLTGRTPTSQRFSAASLENGTYVDVIEDGLGRRIAPLLKTQLSASDPLLDVKQLDRILSRNQQMFGSLAATGGGVRDNLTTMFDSFNGLWKASTLLRGGYALRAPSEEIVAGAVKFGIISAMADLGKGGANWFLNRPQFLKAVVGKDGIDVLDPNALFSAKVHDLPYVNVKVNKAYPLVQSRITKERSDLKALESQSKKLDRRIQRATQQKTIDDLLNKKADLMDQIDDSKNIIQEFVDYSHEILRQAELPTRRRLGEGSFTYRGQKVPQPFNREWANVIPRDQITSDNAMAAVYARAEAIETAKIIKAGSWKTLKPEDIGHMESWLDAINKQLGQDPLTMKILEDPSLKTAYDWLATPVGKAHLRSLTRQAQDPDVIIGSIVHTLDQYLPEGTGLRAKLLNGEEISAADLRQAIAQADFPLVHGEEVRALTSGKSATRIIDDTIAKGFKALGTVPTDIMSRQPIYIRAHAARMKNLIDNEMSYRQATGKNPGQIDPATFNKMMETADRQARADISQVVYDPQRTTATQALRFVAPFMSAHMDGLERWAGLIAERPEIVGTASKIYNAPVAANLVTDKEGHLVGEDGYVDVKGPDGKVIERRFVPLQDRIFNLKVPGQTRNIKGLGAVEEGGFPISMASMNTILPGDPWWNPGTGPLTQIVASKIAMQSPAVGDFLQWSKVLPYGPTGTIDAITPKYMRDVWEAYTGDDPGNVKFQKTMLEEWQRQSAEHANGGPAPDMKKVVENAKTFSYFKALSSFISPASVSETPLTGTPYQFFVDQYKGLVKLDPKNASAIFLKTYGSDYYAFTASMNKSIGIASTAPAVETAQMYKDLIDKNPEMAGFIVGPYNQGEFSQTANKILQDTSFAGKPGREKMTAYDAIAENQKSLGWQHYQKMSGVVDAALFRSGYRSYEEDGAEGFKSLKSKIVSTLSAEYPEWEKDFNTTDKGAVQRRIKAFESLVKDERLASDPLRSDIGKLKIYLQTREVMKKQLASREDKTLTAESNRDLARRWAQIQMTLVEQDTKFNDVFNRYLANDSLQ